MNFLLTSLLSTVTVETGIKSGLGDIYALRDKQTEFIVNTLTVCDGTWFKDGEQVHLNFPPTWYASGWC